MLAHLPRATARTLRVFVLLLAPAWLVPSAAGGHLLYRCYYDSGHSHDHMMSESPECEDGSYKMESALGCTADAGTMLYRCRSLDDGDHMASTSSTCEGAHYVNEAPLGYLFTTMPPGGHAIYRCYGGPAGGGDDHMESIDPNCGNWGPAARDSGIVGYLAGACGGTGKDWPTFASPVGSVLHQPVRRAAVCGLPARPLRLLVLLHRQAVGSRCQAAAERRSVPLEGCSGQHSRWPEI